MRRIATCAAATLALGVLSACGGQRRGDLRTFRDSASYAIGLSMGRSVAEVEADVDLDRVIQGLTDVVADREPALPDEQARWVLQQFMMNAQAAAEDRRREGGEVNMRDGDAYREQNARRPDVTTTPSGLQIEVLEPGSGARPGPSDRVTVHYRGTLIDGKEFDSSHQRGQPATFQVDQVIPGWTEGLQQMQVGGKYRLVIPPNLGYGAQGAGPDIGPNATLVFEVELLEIAR